MTKTIDSLIVELENSKTIADKERITKKLAIFGSIVVPSLIAYAKKSPVIVLRRGEVIMVIDKMAPPISDEAIKYTLVVAADPNNYMWDLAFNILIRTGRPIVPHLKDAIQYYFQDVEEYHMVLESYYQLILQLDPVIQRELSTEVELLKNVINKNILEKNQ